MQRVAYIFGHTDFDSDFYTNQPPRNYEAAVRLFVYSCEGRELL
jgi:hypothetical protein